MVRPVPNFCVANASSPVFLNYYLLKSIVRLCYPRPKQGVPLGPLFPDSYMAEHSPALCGSSCLPIMAILNPSSGGFLVCVWEI